MSKRLAFFLLFDVYHEGLVDVHGLVEESFFVINRGFGGEGKMVKDMKNDVMKSALIVSFARVPEFHEVIIRDHIDEEILEECLLFKGGIMGFFKIFVLCIKFGSTHNH